MGRHKQENENMKKPLYIKAAEVVAHATGVTTILKPVWDEYKKAEAAIDRSERLLAEHEAERRGRK